MVLNISGGEESTEEEEPSGAPVASRGGRGAARAVRAVECHTVTSEIVQHAELYYSLGGVT